MDSTRSITSVLRPVLLLTVAMAVVPLATAIPGTYITDPTLANKRFVDNLPGGKNTSIDNRTVCEGLCVNHTTCDMYAFSSFQRTCCLYKSVVGSKAILQNMFNIYVRQKTEDEGYIKYSDGYIKMILTLGDAYFGTSMCKLEGGSLIPIKNDKTNKALKKILQERQSTNVFIGINDQAQEMTWVYNDDNVTQVPDDVAQWEWNGVWARTDRNCAVIQISGNWIMANCGDYHYSFCRIPMF